MPQGARSDAEKLSFDWMLSNVNLLYLGLSVLILQDVSTRSRFWTQYVPSKLVGTNVQLRHR